MTGEGERGDWRGCHGNREGGDTHGIGTATGMEGAGLVSVRGEREMGKWRERVRPGVREGEPGSERGLDLS